MIYIPPAIALVVFLTLGFATWSYRDVANRHSGTGPSTEHDGHGGH